MSDKAFFDTNILIYALASGDRRKDVARDLLARGGVVSVQVLNEFASVARRKLAFSWPDVITALGLVRTLCGEPIPITATLHEAALSLAQDHSLNIYDALIVSAAAEARCMVLLSEDMQHGRRFSEGLRIENPFLK